MFKVFVNVHHSDSQSEHIERFYTGLYDAVNYIKALSLVLDIMQNGGNVVSYDIQLISGCKEDD